MPNYLFLKKQSIINFMEFFEMLFFYGKINNFKICKKKIPNLYVSGDNWAYAPVSSQQ